MVSGEQRTITDTTTSTGMRISSVKVSVILVLLGLAAFYVLVMRRLDLDKVVVGSVSAAARAVTIDDVQQQDCKTTPHRKQDDGGEYHHVLSTLEDLLPVASVIAQKKGVVLFSIINDGYIDLVFSWLCNTAVIDDVHQHVLFLTTDVSTGQRVHKQWPAVHVASMNDTRYDGAVSFGTAAYLRLMVQRTQLIQHLLQSNVRLLLFEVDFVWLANPLPTILSQSDKTHADVVATRVHGSRQTCGCFFLLNPTPATKALWTRLAKQIDVVNKKIANFGRFANVKKFKNDQNLLSMLINAKYGGLRVSYLSERLFPDGKWYNQSSLRALKPDPLIIHNNWIAGNDKKIERAKQFGHWFLVNSSDSDVICNMTNVRRLVLT